MLAINNTLPGHAVKLLMPDERVHYAARPRILSTGMLLFFASVLVALAVFSAVIEDPGFMRLLALPAFPLLGSVAAALFHSPVIFVTDSRIVYARRSLKPLSFGLVPLKATRINQSRLERSLGYGELILLYPHPTDSRDGVFLSFTLSKLRDPWSLNAEILAAAAAAGNHVMKAASKKGLQ